MGSLPGIELLMEGVRRHWVSALFLFISLLTILIISGMRWWWRKTALNLIEESFLRESEFDLLPPFDSRDREAIDLIAQARKGVWDVPDEELGLTVEALSAYAIRIVRAIAAVYFPEAPEPEYEASLIESLQLVRRVSGRLIRLASVAPFKLLGDRKFSEFQRFYQAYKKFNEYNLIEVLKRHKHLYRVARWALHARNIANPFYWAGKEISREGYFFVLRWFYMAVISQVGKEAMRLYSGRHFQREEERDAALVCHRLFALALEWKGPSPEEWAALVEFVANRSALEPESKLQILSGWSRNRLPKDLPKQELQTASGVKWYREGLTRLKEADPHAFLPKERGIQEELARLDAPEEGQ